MAHGPEPVTSRPPKNSALWFVRGMSPFPMEEMVAMLFGRLVEVRVRVPSAVCEPVNAMSCVGDTQPVLVARKVPVMFAPLPESAPVSE